MRKAVMLFLTSLMSLLVSLLVLSAPALFCFSRRTVAEHAAAETLVSEAAAFELTTSENQTVSRYSAFSEQNSDYYGWLCIPGNGDESAVLDTPVMYSPTQPEYYLHRAFNKSYAASGTPFLADITPPGITANRILHGHNMRNGDSFAGLLSFTDEAFFRAHRTVSLETSEGRTVWTVYALLRLDTGKRSDLFCYRSVTTDEFPAYLAEIRLHAVYKMLSEEEWREALLLSTCGTERNERILLIAVR